MICPIISGIEVCDAAGNEWRFDVYCRSSSTTHIEMEDLLRMSESPDKWVTLENGNKVRGYRLPTSKEHE